MGVGGTSWAEAAHSSGPFLLSGPLMSPLRQSNSTIVAVSIFLLLSSLTYLLFKLSPRSVTKGMRVAVNVLLYVCVFVCMWMCVHANVRGRWGAEGQTSNRSACAPPLSTVRSWVAVVFKTLPWASGEFPSCQDGGAVAEEGSRVTRAKSPEALDSSL